MPPLLLPLPGSPQVPQPESQPGVPQPDVPPWLSPLDAPGLGLLVDGFRSHVPRHALRGRLFLETQFQGWHSLAVGQVAVLRPSAGRLPRAASRAARGDCQRSREDAADRPPEP